MVVVEAFLVFAVAAFDLAIVARGVRTDELVKDTKLGGSTLKECRQIALGIGEAVGELEAVVRLNAFDFHASASKGSDDFSQEIG